MSSASVSSSSCRKPPSIVIESARAALAAGLKQLPRQDVDILLQRLRRVQSLGGAFAEVDFSAQMKDVINRTLGYGST